jgi:peptidyl-Lys metalloendopeptidase
MNTLIKRWSNLLVAFTMTLACAACQSTSDTESAYLDRTVEPLLDSADGRLSDLGITCEIWPTQDDGNSVEVRLENYGEVAVELSTRGTAWDHMSPAMRVLIDEVEMPYVGIVAHRGPPTEADIVRIEPGKAIATVYDVGSQNLGYQPGAYQITLRSPVVSVRVEGVPLAMQHDCGVLFVNKSSAPARPEVEVAAQALIYNDSSCSGTEQARIERMEAIARPATKIARSFVRSDSTLYVEWFGTWSSANGNYVDDVLSDLETGWDTFTGDCHVDSVGACNGPNICDGANAWVCRGDDPDLVHICSGFFAQPTISVEAWSSQVGILAHEKSHLVSGDSDQSHSSCSDGGDTKCYGAPDARALAVHSPSQAIANGENYEKFVAHAYEVAVLLPAVIL